VPQGDGMSTAPSAVGPEPIGVWLVGARGDIAATLMVGTAALARGLVSNSGLTTARPPFDRLPLAAIADLRFGGIDVHDTPLRESALSLYRRSRTVDRETLDATEPDLAAIESALVHAPEMVWDPSTVAGGLHNQLPDLQTLTEDLRGHLRAFRDRHRLARVVVVNLMSSLPHPAPSPQTDSAAGIESLLDANRHDLISPSVCYAWAAIAEGCPYINFTPNAGTRWGGIAELAVRNRVPFYGDDGKTGETLIKTALAHLFAYRNLHVLSWEGVNLLGNNDGRALADPRNREAKLANKGQVLDEILGYSPHAGVSINYVPSLGDWKTAWDLIHFKGFLDVPMTMQFTWQGCDSVLAAPLVLDLVRLADLAQRRGEYGPMPWLACFFKNPLGVQEMDLHRQFERLLEYAQTVLADDTRQAPAETSVTTDGRADP
jgi:myo-inositol-1-phosphate synthase